MAAVYKMYCLVSKEAIAKMKGNRGKMMAQAGHAFLHSFFDSFFRHPWAALAYKFSKHAYKITLVVENEAELEFFRNAYRDTCGVSLVKDAGFTVFKDEAGNSISVITCLGLGPIRSDKIGPELKALKLFI